MTAASNGEGSLAELASRIQLAQGDLVTRDLMLQSALEQFQQTNRDANSQARYLTTAEAPVVPEDPAYPRKFESTLLAFLVFGEVYLLLSITASVLREQISG
jgi:capsular polysaccharide transport system permease protein